MKRTVLIAVGGSGGHLLPAQHLGANLQEDSKVIFAGFGLSLSPFFQKTNYEFYDISSAPLRPVFPFFKCAGRGVLQSLKMIRQVNPDVIVGFGSFHVFPVLAAAVLLRKKIVLYEANLMLGKVNRLFLPFAKKVALQFPLAKPIRYSCEYVSYLPKDKREAKIDKQQALCFYGFDASLPVCLVFGGSQGAEFFNQTAPSILSGCQVIHCTGKDKWVDQVRLAYEKRNIRCFVQSFEHEMARAYAAADFALARSGAASIEELIRYAVPAVLVPFPQAADRHQNLNAHFFCNEAKGGIWFSQHDAADFRVKIETCMKEKEKFRRNLQLFYQKTKEKVELAELVRDC